MESTRQQKIERLIQKDLSDILLKYARAMRGTLISVSEVRISPDLSIAHVYLSISPRILAVSSCTCASVLATLSCGKMLKYT